MSRSSAMNPSALLGDPRPSGNGALCYPSESQVSCGSGNAGCGSRLGLWLTLWPHNHLSMFALTGAIASPRVSQVG